MLSHRIVIWDHVSDIHTTIFPSIHLNPDKAYSIGLIQFSVFNSTFNITETNNKLYYFNNKIWYIFTKSDTYEPVLKVIPPGLYTFDTLVSIINELVPTSNLRIVRINDSGYYVLHTTDIHPVFTRPDSVLQVFGFPNNVSHLNHIRIDDPAFLALNTSLLQVQHNKRKRDIVHTDNTLKETTLETDHHHHRFSVQRQGDKAIIPYPNDIPTISNETSTEDLPTYYYVAPFAASFNRYKEVYINCPLITNSYKNNTHSRALHSFMLPPASISHSTFVDIPRNIIYLPLNRQIRNICEIVLRIEDENSHLIDFGGEYVTIVLHICELAYLT